MSEVPELPRLVDVHYAFAETEHGRYLGSKVRWEKYKPADVTNERWRKLLGVDADNLHHGKLMGTMARSFARQMNAAIPGYFNLVEGAVFELGGHIHDWGEADPTTGDVSFSDKVIDDTERERLICEAHINRYFPDETAAIYPLLHQALTEVIYTEDTKLGQAFNAIERVGYMRTGLRAARHVVEGTAPDCHEGLRWLTTDTLTNQPLALIDRAGVYPPVNDYITGQKDRISEAFGIVIANPDVFLNYGEQKRRGKQMAFETNYQAWRQWRIRQELGL